MIKIEKRQVKVISLVIAALFLIGVAAVTGPATSAYAAAATSASSAVGIVNYQLLVSQHPDAAKAKEIMEAAYKEASSDFNAKSAAMNDKAKQEYYQQLQERLQNKERELLKDIDSKVVAAVKDVAEAKGLSIVVDNSTAVYGGEDITVEVMKKITGK